MSDVLLCGSKQKVYLKEQTTYDSLLDFVYTDSIAPVKGSFKLDPEYAHEESKEAMGTPSLVDEIPTAKSGKWSGQCYIKPNTAGTAPSDVGVLLKAAFGTETVVGATSVTYSFSDTTKVPLQALQQVDEVAQHLASGMIVENLTIEASKGATPSVSASGTFASFGHSFQDEVGVGDVAYNVTTMPIDDDARGSLEVNGKFCFENDDGGTAGTVVSGNGETYDFSGAGSETLTVKVDGAAAQTATFENADFSNPSAGTAAEIVVVLNTDIDGITATVETGTPNKVRITSNKVGSGSSVQVTGGTANAGLLAFSTDAVAGTAGVGYRVTAVDDSDGAAEVTFTPAIKSRAGHDAGDEFYPWAPTHTPSGTRLTSGYAELNIDTVEFGFQSAKIGIKTGNKPLDKEANSITPTGIGCTDRRVTVELTCYFFAGNAGNAAIMGRAWQEALHEVELRIGPDTAGSRMTINIPSIRFEVVPLEMPEAEEAVVVLKGTARMDTTSGDELEIVLD